MKSLSDKENEIDDWFSKIVEKDLEHWDDFAEVWHFLGCVQGDGIRSFLDYPDIEKTLKSLKNYGFNKLWSKLNDLLELSGVISSLDIDKYQNNLCTEFEVILEESTPTIVETLHKLLPNRD